MKKSLLTLAFAFAGATVFAQDLTSRKGEPILPEAGDWAIGINAVPFLNYAGNLLNNSNANNAPAFGFTNVNQTITGKYFITDKMAYRAALRIGINSNSQTNTVANDNGGAAKEDKLSNRNTFIGLGFGIENRRGKTRLQGFYGAQANIMFGGSGQTFTYGNEYSANNTTPTTTVDFTNGAVDSLTSFSRVTANKNGSMFGFGIRGFIGAEYFFLPKMSIGGEFGWGIALMNNGAGERTTEAWTNGTLVESTAKTGKRGNFAIDTDNNMFGNSFGGQLFLALHF